MLQTVAATSSRSSLRDASRGDYVVPRTNRKTADRAFSAAAPRAWNQLPTELKRTQSTSAFRRGLKTPFQPCILLRITRYNDYVMRPRSYSMGLRNRKTYASANANANAKHHYRDISV